MILKMVVGLMAGWFVCAGLTSRANAQSSTGESILSSAGLDVSLLDDVKNGTVRAFVEQESDLFARLSAAVIRVDSNPPDAIPEGFDLMTALQTPQKYKGRYVQVRGHVRRISSIQITSPRLREITGKTEYHQVDLFVSTQRTNFHLEDDQGEVTIGGTWGVTLIFYDMPELVLGARQVTITVPGFYLKNWSHKTVETREVSSELRRPSPIIFCLGSRMKHVITPKSEGAGSVIAWFWGGLIALTAALAFWQWLGSRNRKRPSTNVADRVDLSYLDNDSK